MARARVKRERARKGDGARPRKREDGRWVAVLDEGWADGKRKRRYIYGATEGECADKLDAARGKRRRGIDLSADRLTIAAWLDEWMETAAPNLRASTVESYRAIARRHVVPGLGTVKLGDLGAPAVDRWLRGLTASGLSARTVTYARAVLRRALGHAVRLRLVEVNAAQLSTPPKAIRREMVAFSPAELRALLAHVAGDPAADPPRPRDRLEALYVVAASTGMREGEILGLRWAAVDLDAGTLRVTHSLTRLAVDDPKPGELKTRPVLDEPKTASSRRTIALPASALAALREHRRRHLEERLLAGEEWDSSWDLAFCTALGQPLHPSSVVHSFQRHLKAAGLPERRFHDLRHACASLLLAARVSPVQVAATLGHASVVTTMSIYAHAIPGQERVSADTMDRLLASASGT